MSPWSRRGRSRGGRGAPRACGRRSRRWSRASRQSRRSCAARACEAPARRSLPNAARAAAGRCNREPREALPAASNMRPSGSVPQPRPRPSGSQSPCSMSDCTSGQFERLGLPSGPVTLTTASTSSSRSWSSPRGRQVDDDAALDAPRLDEAAGLDLEPPLLAQHVDALERRARRRGDDARPR